MEQDWVWRSIGSVAGLAGLLEDKKSAGRGESQYYLKEAVRDTAWYYTVLSGRVPVATNAFLETLRNLKQVLAYWPFDRANAKNSMWAQHAGRDFVHVEGKKFGAFGNGQLPEEAAANFRGSQTSLKAALGLTEAVSHFSIARYMGRGVVMKKPGQPSGWRGVMNQRPQPSDFGLSQLADNVDSITQRQRVRVSRIRHGIGGGMRLSDETEITRSVGSHFSAEYMGRRLSLTGGRVVFGIYATVLAAILLILHIHLRFEIHDMNMQQHALQTVHQKLERQANALDRQMAMLIDLPRLRDYAVMKLDMVEYEEQDELPVATYLEEKYSPEDIKADRERRAEWEIAQQNQKPVNGFLRLTKAAWALASSN